MGQGAKLRGPPVTAPDAELSCAWCLGQPHKKGKYKAKLQCSNCFGTGHPAVKCWKAGHLKPTIPKLLAQ